MKKYSTHDVRPRTQLALANPKRCAGIVGCSSGDYRCEKNAYGEDFCPSCKADRSK